MWQRNIAEKIAQSISGIIELQRIISIENLVQSVRNTVPDEAFELEILSHVINEMISEGKLEIQILLEAKSLGFTLKPVAYLQVATVKIPKKEANTAPLPPSHYIINNQTIRAKIKELLADGPMPRQELIEELEKLELKNCEPNTRETLIYKILDELEKDGATTEQLVQHKGDAWIELSLTGLPPQDVA